MRAKKINEEWKYSVQGDRYEAVDDETGKRQWGRVEAVDTEDGPRTGLKYVPDETEDDNFDLDQMIYDRNPDHDLDESAGAEMDFSEALWKIDKYMYEEDAQEFYEILDDVDLSYEEKVSEIESFIEERCYDEDRMYSYFPDRNATVRDFAEYIVQKETKQNESLATDKRQRLLKQHMKTNESQTVRSLLKPKTEEEVQQALHSATREELNVELCDAADQGDVERVKLLLAAGANPGANDGWALHLAVAEDHTEVIKLLKHHMNRSYGSFKRRMGLTEGMFDDPGNLKALASYGKMITGELDSYMLEVKRPFRIMIDGEDNAKFKFLFNKYRIEFELIHKDDAVMAESIYENEEPLVSLSIKDLSWDDVKEVGNLPYLSLPVEEGMSRQVKDENEFESWKNDFIKRYGSDGYLEGHKAGRYYSWKVVENSRYEEKRQRTIDSISSYYQKKGSGGYTGD